MRRFVVSLLITLALLLAACNGTPENAPAEDADLTVEASATPEPTETPTSTPEPTSTPDLAATEAAEATERAAPVLEEIEAELALRGYSTEGGQLVWVQEEPISVVLTQQNYLGRYDDLGIDTMFANFILKVDVTWETETGLAGCGIIFRSEKDLDRGAQAQFYTGRLLRAPFWGFELYRNGQFIVNMNTGLAPSIMDEQGSTNTYYLIVNGLDVLVYANRAPIGSASLTADLDTGRLAFLTWSDTGISTCTFENAWVWELP